MRSHFNSNHRKSIRLRNFDYSSNATYFVTICTAGREQLFGKAQDGLVGLNGVGAMIEREWLRSSMLRAELELHSFVVMPNHLHGLLTITPIGDGPPIESASAGTDLARLRTTPRSLGSFVAGYKGATTRRFRLICGDDEASLWQRGYYEHVVRNEDDFARICDYISNNPFTWDSDAENSGRSDKSS